MASGATTTEGPAVDAAIVGAGPAGRWLAALLVRRGATVAVFDPHSNEPWPNNYGIWLDEVAGLPLPVPITRRWEKVTVHLESSKTLHRPYGRIDNGKFRQRLDRIIDTGTAHWHNCAVTGVRPHANGCVVDTDDGRAVRARIAVDASGATAGLLERPAEPTPAFQRAWGVFARFDGDPLNGDQMVLMDYRPIRHDGAHQQNPPSFLYGMHLGEDRYFVEETVLVSRSTPSFSVLRRRLHRRLKSRDADAIEIENRERCHIPMGTPLAPPQPPVVGFGASAGLVHPATGYQMTRMLRAGPDLAEELAVGFAKRRSCRTLCRRAHRLLWPPEVQRARGLLMFGRDVLLEFDAAALRHFFENFFSLPDQKWRDYLRGDAGFGRICAVMWSLFAQADPPLRRSLLRCGLGGAGRLFEAIWSTTGGARVIASKRKEERPGDR